MGDVANHAVVIGTSVSGAGGQPSATVIYTPDEEHTGPTSIVILDAGFGGDAGGSSTLVPYGNCGLVETENGWLVIGTVQREGSVVLNVVDGGAVVGHLFSTFNLDGVLKGPTSAQALAAGASQDLVGELLLNADGTFASTATISAPRIGSPASGLLRDDGGSVFVGLNATGQLSLARFFLDDAGVEVDSTFGDAGLVQTALGGLTTFGAAALLGNDYCVSYRMETTGTAAIACLRYVPASDGGADLDGAALADATTEAD